LLAASLGTSTSWPARGGYFQTFPVGVAAELDADARTLHLLDPPLEPADAPAAAAASQGRSMTGSPA
jgi:hypothetical protein